MGLREQVDRIRPDGKYEYELPQIHITFVPPVNRLHQYLLSRFTESLTQTGDRVTVTQKGKFPQNANAAIEFTDDITRERDPSELYGRHEKPRSHKKAMRIITVPSLEQSLGTNTNLSDWMRGILVLNACHDAIVIEGNSQDNQMQEGARTVIASMEGNVGIETYRGDGLVFFDNLTKRLKLLCGAEMVNKKEGLDIEKPTFEQWCDRTVPRGIAYASKLLGERGYLWDLDLTKHASPSQVEKILFALKQAGLGEGNISVIDRELGVMAITETGVSKTHINPQKGEVVAVTGITENGSVHWIMQGLPQGHPFVLFRNPSLGALQDTKDFVRSMARRGKLTQFVRDSLTKRSRIGVDHPPSIETHENALFFMATALWEAGKIETFEDFLRYLKNGFDKAEVLPVIPEGVNVAADALIHIHKVPKLDQHNPTVKVVMPNLAKFGYRHSPPCGSRESAMLFIDQVIASYNQYGPPASEDEVRLITLPGHGCYAWGYNGIRNLADSIVNKVDFEPEIPRL